MKQDGTTYLVEVGELKRINTSKCGESDAPLISDIRLVEADRVRCIEDIRHTGGVVSILIGSRTRHEKHGHEVLMDAHWLTKIR